MTEGFQTVLAASDEERRDLFVGAADRLRTNEQNIEKDFWVCWTLKQLFSIEALAGRLLFKGGTSQAGLLPLRLGALCGGTSRKAFLTP